MGQRAAGNAERVREGQRVGIARAGLGAERRLVHQRAKREVREEKSPRLLPHQLRGLAPQHAPGAWSGSRIDVMRR